MKSPADSPRILVVEDDERVRTVISWALEANGFVVEHAHDGLGALSRVRADPPALVVLDLSLPGLDGLDVLHRLRTGTGPAGPDDGAAPVDRPTDVPVIVLSGRGGETDRIVGLDLGADDYLVKPFSPGELLARVRSVLRRSPPAPSGAIPAGAHRPAEGRDARNTRTVVLDRAAREVTVDGVVVELTAKEFDLLDFLVAHPRRVFSRPQLLAHVWTSNAGWQSEATVTEHVHRLRRKIESNPRSPGHLRTLRGAGYRWEP